MKKSIRNFMYFFPFLKEVVKRDFKKKYYKSVLGVVWSMLSPLLMMIVISVIFSTLFRRNIPHYPIYWLCGNLMFAMACREDIDAIRWLMDRDLRVFLMMAKEVATVLETQALENQGPYVLHF